MVNSFLLTNFRALTQRQSQIDSEMLKDAPRAPLTRSLTTASSVVDECADQSLAVVRGELVGLKETV